MVMIPDLPATNHENTKEGDNALSISILKTIFKNVQEGILLFNKKGCLYEINNAGLKLHGFEVDDKKNILYRPFQHSKIYDADHRELSVEEWPVKQLLSGKSFSNLNCIVKPVEQGPETRISYSGFPQLNEEGQFIEGVLFARKTESPNTNSELVANALAQQQRLKELEVYQQKVKDDREFMHTIIDAIPVMVIIYDKSMKSFLMNRAFETITGWTSEDIKTTGIMELLYPDPVYREEVLNFMLSLDSGFKDIVIRTSDGRDIETSWANVELPDGKQVGVGFDISQRKLLEKELIKARERAEWENQVQYAFIQNISHEVRTPMNSILGFTELLQKEVKREKEAEFLNAIDFNGKQLLHLINDIIDFSRLDNNQVLLTKEKIKVGDLLNQIEQQLIGMKNAYNKRNLNVIMNKPDPMMQAILNTDHFRLQQVILNLIGNAIKYTWQGSVEIGCEIRESKQDVLFFVKDTGIGINENDKEKVFKRFNRLHDTRSFEFRGTGLGLAICKHLVKLLGGEIWFESELGKGTTFYFSHPYLKLEKSEEETPVPFVEDDLHGDDVSLPDLKDKVILIVEDDSFSYMMMYHMLEETKALILHADSGSKAVEVFGKYRPDLVFLDIRIPEMDGYEVIRHIHQLNDSVPVIAQTANALPEDRKRLADAGFDFHITKPISRESIYSVLNKFLPVEKID